MKKILILYASYGTGHIQVSNALKSTFEKTADVEVLLVDLFAEAHPLINAITKFIYLQSYSLLSSFYGWSYYSTQEMRHDRMTAHWFNSFGLHKLREIIDRERPDVVINTFPMLVMPEFRRKTGKIIPTYSVLTDFALHQRWVHPEIDRYFVATEELREQLVGKGVSASRIVVSGIPLREEFEQQMDTAPLYERYGLPQEKRIALVVAGALGVTKGLEDVCERFAEGENWEVVLVCGKNAQVKERMTEHFAQRSNVHVFGYVQQIHELMRIAACMVTKAGGITLSEAIALNVPLLIFRPVPGQERDNAQFLVEQGAALVLQNEEDLAQISQILTAEELLSNMRKRLQMLQQPHASETIVQDVLQAGEVMGVYATST
ncbi:MAG: MGDG synthase family glycosyltransferase [Tumebacillaceae bacterium]